MTADPHQHFWDPAHADHPWMTEVAPLRRRFAPEDLEPLLRRHDVTGTVVVQARHSLDETRTLLELATAKPFVLASSAGSTLRATSNSSWAISTASSSA